MNRKRRSHVRAIGIAFVAASVALTVFAVPAAVLIPALVVALTLPRTKAPQHS